MSDSGKLASRLLILRVSCGIFFLQWGIEKIVDPDRTVRIFKYFYFSDIHVYVVPLFGIAQILLAILFIAGVAKTYTYLSVLILHGMSVVATWRELLFPFREGTHNHVFLTAVPVLAALWLLFSLRTCDMLWAWQGGFRPSDKAGRAG